MEMNKKIQSEKRNSKKKYELTWLIHNTNNLVDKKIKNITKLKAQ
jgi:hypothetical protein